MRDLAVRTAIAAVVSAGLLLGGAGAAVASEEAATSTVAEPTSAASTATTDPSAPETTSAATPSTVPSSETTAPESTAATSETTTAPTTTAATSETTTAPTTTAAETTTDPTTTAAETTTDPTTTSAPSTWQPAGSASVQQGCLGEVTLVVTVPGLPDGAAGTVVLTLPGDRAPVSVAVVAQGGQAVVVLDPAALTGVTDLEALLVLTGEDGVYGPYALSLDPVPDGCVGEGTVVLSRDCTTPDAVLAAVDVSGLTEGPHGVGVVGVTADGQPVLLASDDVQVAADGRLTGTLPLTSLAGGVPLAGFTGVALVVDGTTYASVAATDVSVAECVVPAPLPAAPPSPPVVVAPAAAPTTTATTATTTTAAAAPATVHPARPAAQPASLARTGSESGSLLLLAAVFLVVGGLTTLVARRTAR